MAKLAFYDLTRICIGVTRAVWAAVPDPVQLHRFSTEILKMLEVWTREGKLLCAGGFDGAFYLNELATKHRWVATFPSDFIEAQEESQREFYERHNEFIHTIRGPIAEGGFATQVNSLKKFSERWHFSFEFHNKIYPLVEALLNINKRVQRGEAVRVTVEEAQELPLLAYSSQLLDDLLRGDVDREDETDDENVFNFDEEAISVTLKALFSNEQRFAEVLYTSQKGKEKDKTG